MASNHSSEEDENGVRKVLIIGVSDYQDKNLEHLPFCKNDAEEMYKLLSKPSLPFGISYTNKMVGEVKEREMKKAIVHFFKDPSIRSQDTLLFYFAGHGVTDYSGDVFMASSEADSNNPFIGGFPFQELTKLMNVSYSTRIITILDCCYSGALELAKGRGDSNDAAKKARNNIDYKSNALKQGRGKCLLAASESVERAYEIAEKNHGIFTYYLLEGLKGKSQSADEYGNVTVDRLADYVYYAISNLSPDKRPNQMPIRKVEGGGRIILASYPQLSTNKTIDSSNIRVEDTYSIFAEGRAHLEKGWFDTALHSFGKVLAVNPYNPDAWYNKGLSLYQLQRYKEAIECYDKALEINPNDTDTWYGKGLCFAALEDHEDAINCYDKALQIDPGYKDAFKGKDHSITSLKEKGSKYRLKGEYTHAIEYYDIALKGNPKDSFAWYNKGLSLYQLQRYKEAIECYDKALEINPRDSSSWYNKGLSFHNLQRYEDAINCYDKALQIYSKNASAWFGKGLAYKELGRHKEAEKCFSKARKLKR